MKIQRGYAIPNVLYKRYANLNTEGNDVSKARERYGGYFSIKA